MGIVRAPVLICIGGASLCHLEGGIYICSPRKPCGPNMLDELLKGSIVILADLPRKGLRDSRPRRKGKSWLIGKMYDLCRVLKTGILVVLTVTSGLGDSCIKSDDSCCVKILITYCLMLYIFYVTLIMRLWDLYNLVAILVEFDMDSLLLFPPHLMRSLGLWSTSQLDPVEWS